MDEVSPIVEDVPEAASALVPLPPPSTPIADALLALRDAGGLTAGDCREVRDLVGVRTLGDLQTVLERGEVEEKLARKLRKVLG